MLMDPRRLSIDLSAGLVLLTAVALLSACSLVRLAYENAEWLIVRWADQHLQLDHEQEAALRLRLQAAIETHREELLPETILFLRALTIAVEQSLSPAETRCAIRWSQSLYRRTARLLLPLAAETLTALSPEQIDYLGTRIEEKDREFRDEYLQGTTDQRFSRRAEKIVERLEKWNGELSEPQAQIVFRRTVGLPDTAPAWYRYRGARQTWLLASLRAGADSATIQGILDDWWVTQRDVPESLRRDVETFLDGFAVMISSLDRSLESWQRQRVTGRLSGIADDLTELLPEDGMPQATAHRYELTACSVQASG